MNKVEFRCIGDDNFIKGYSCFKGIHSYQDTIDKVNPRPEDPRTNLGLCRDCRLKVAGTWFKRIVSEKQWDKSFDTFIQERNPKIYKTTKAFKPVNGNSIMLWGNTFGTGKTHLSIAILREYLCQYMLNYNMIGHEFDNKHRVPANMTSETELIDKIRASFNDDDGESESEIVARHTDVDVLLIDDVGKVKFAKDDFLNRIYFMIIDRMYNKKKSLIITCNESPTNICSHIGQACMSRLNEMCGNNIFEVTGKDYRMEKK